MAQKVVGLLQDSNHLKITDSQSLNDFLPFLQATRRLVEFQNVECAAA